MDYSGPFRITQEYSGSSRGYTGSPRTGNLLYKQPKHRQPVIQPAQAQATSSICSSSTSNKLYMQPQHKQPVIPAAQARATSYCTHAAQAQATSYTGSSSTSNQLYRQLYQADSRASGPHWGTRRSCRHAGQDLREHAGQNLRPQPKPRPPGILSTSATPNAKHQFEDAPEYLAPRRFIIGTWSLLALGPVVPERSRTDSSHRRRIQLNFQPELI